MRSRELGRELTRDCARRYGRRARALPAPAARRRDGWLARADFPIAGRGKMARRAVRGFLRDLAALAERFGLGVAGRHVDRGEWLALADLLHLARTRAGGKWLSRCVLRVYTEADYLARWRRRFAAALGFATIPDPDTSRSDGGPAASAARVKAALRRRGLGQKHLARALKVSAAQVSQYLAGKKAWTPAWAARVAAALAQMEGTSKAE